jgi:probable phosphoglycerate mutase
VAPAVPSGTYNTRLFSSSSENPSLPDVEPRWKRLFFVRHGEVINPGGDRPVFYGAMDVSLSELGKAEARAAANYLKQFKLEYVVCSPLKRAIYGAKKVADAQKEKNNEMLILDGFRELDRGAWCGLTKGEIGVDNMAQFDACDESVTPEGGESFPFLKSRVLKARDIVLGKLGEGQSAAVVSHLQVTRSLLSDALDVPTEEMTALKVATASMTCIDYNMETGEKVVRFQNFKPQVGLEASNDLAN